MNPIFLSHGSDGTDQIRSYEINGNTLTLSWRLANPANGTEAQYVVAWDKVTGPR